ncbi:fibronectin type III domain-containing protein [Paenibacillus hexagrammi]|uniref:Cohesin domain-containing protein n=1 Tax=Paenibacillus hexagrammi TaxID=2908839 RepID=A0ABY3SBV6_9BACL|nr:cohesin domain-containing protein [Paenibacillus sp. YPD9-1]UJF31473.1 cohesin domain-containing protein [Paenibacillus sp. YPD9-1]
MAERIGSSDEYSAIVNGLSNGTVYYAAVTAQDGADVSSLSEEVNVTPIVEAPSKLIVIPGNGSAHVEFPEVPGIQAYKLTYQQIPDGTEVSVSLTTNHTTVENLTNGSTYQFQVSSQGAGGGGEPTLPVQTVPSDDHVIWEDSFEAADLSDYNQDVSTWVEEGGLLKHSSGGDNRGELSVKHASIINGTITAIAKHATTASDWGIVFRGTDYNHAYSFGFENDALYLRKNGENLAGTIPFTAETNGIYELQVVLNGSHIQAYLDGDLKFDVMDHTYTSGMLGLHSWADAQFAYIQASHPDAALEAPQIYSAIAGERQITLKFSEVDGATSYKVKYGTQSGVYTEEMESSAGAVTIQGLENDLRYYFKVVASNGSDETESDEVNAVPRANSQSQLLYYVDAGDGSVTVPEEGENLGIYNGLEDQAYGDDPVTGMKWGYVADDDSTWAKTDDTDAFGTIRQYDANETGKGLAYVFTLPNGTYKVSVGFYDPWQDNNRSMDLVINGATKESNYVIGDKIEVKSYGDIAVTGGELTLKIVKRGSSKPMLSWIKIENNPDPAPTLTWSGVTSVQSGQDFEATLRLNTVTNNVYAQDMTLQFDPEKVEFVSAEAMKPGLTIVGQLETPGKVRFLTADLQPDSFSDASLDLIKLKLKAKEADETQTSSLSLSDVVFADGNGAETSIGSPSPWNFDIVFVDMTGLPGDVNGDRTVRIGDLAMVASHYGLTSADPDWNEFKNGDINHDGRIDIEDLTAIARLIIGE